MINCKNVAAAQAESYYRADDYYTKGAPLATWTGKGVQVLGLDGKEADRHFADLLRGRLPNGTEIAAGAGGKRRAGTDLTISAPKSVSIAALINGDERILAAHRAAVQVALAEVEAHIAARVTVAGVTSPEMTSNMICRTVEHDTSRLGDPNLHTHCVILNATQRADGAWVAIENREIYRIQRELDMVYKSELAVRLASHGYSLRSTKNGFELAAVSDVQIREFSRRTEDIDRALEDRGTSRERASAKEREKAALNTRDRKEIYDRDALRTAWQARGQGVRLEPVRPAAALAGLVKPSAEVAREALAYGRDHLGEREMAWAEDELLRAAMGAAWGSATWSEIKAETARAEVAGELIRKADGTFTTERGRLLEETILATEMRGRNAVSPITCDAVATRREFATTKLNDKQCAAVEMLMTTTNRVAGVQGRAGVGKTTMLQEFRRQAEAAGYRIEGLAPSHSSVKALAEAGITGQTLQAWETAVVKADKQTIILLDEASLASAAQIARVVRVAERSDARVVLVGDSGQYQSVDAGKAFAQLQEAGMQTATVDTMLRQQTKILQDVARLAAEGRGGEALACLGESVHEVQRREDRHAAIAARYAALDQDSRRDCLVLTGSNADRQALNSAIRQRLSLAGKGDVVTTFQREDATTAEKRRAASYVAGQSLRFEKDYRSIGATRGEVWAITRIETNELVVNRADGQEARLKPAQLSGKGFSVGRIEMREITSGDWIRFTGNVAALDKSTLRNGQRATVVSCENGRLRLQVDGARRLVEVDARRALSLDYGYAATGHSAQGLGARTVLLDRDSKSRTASERQFYTDVTRVKEKLEVFTDSTEKLAEAIGRQVDKSVALDELSLLPSGEERAVGKAVFEMER